MSRTSKLAPLILFFGLVHPARGAAADPIPSGYGTAVLDGTLGAGEWDSASPRAVFTGLTGSYLYAMNDLENLYLALWAPDPTFTTTDQFRVRIDSAHDSLNAFGDDELALVAPNTFFDSHFTGEFWGVLDATSNGAGMASAVPGGNFFEMCHPLNSGDPRDMAIAPGDTIGLCIRYLNDNMAPGTDVYPPDCFVLANEQTLYVDLITASGAVAVPAGDNASHGLTLVPNPAGRGAPVEFRYAVPGGGARVAIEVYSVTGERVHVVERGFEAAGARTATWVAGRKSGPVAPGVYFVRVLYDGRIAATGSLVLR